MANEIEKRNEAFLIYQDENGIARVNECIKNAFLEE